MNENFGMRETQPSPPWGRGWTANRAFTSGGGTGEGVKPVKTPNPYREARELRHALAETERAAGYLTRRRYSSLGHGFIRARGGELFVAKGGGGISTLSLAPLTRPASADENASSSHPLPQGGEG